MRLMALVAGMAVTTSALVGCSSGNEDGGPSSGPGGSTAEIPAPAGLVNPGKLTIAADFQGPPFDYLDGDKKIGFDVEFDNAVASLMGLAPDLVDTRFASLIPGLEAGRFDAVISVLYITKERAERIDMVPYAQTGSGFMVKADGAYQPQVAEDLCGHSVAVLAGGFEEQLATGSLGSRCSAEGRPVTVRSFPTDAEATREIAAERADVFFTNHSIVLYRAQKLPELGLSVSNAEPLFPVPAGIGIRKDEPELRAAFEQVVAKLTESGQLGELLSKYGLEPPDPELVQKALAGDLY